MNFPLAAKATTSVRRQQTLTPITEDVEHVDHVLDEVHEQFQEAVTNDVVVDVQDFSGKPHDKSVLMDYLSFHGRKVEKIGRPAPKIEDIVVVTRLSPLIACSLETGDRDLYMLLQRGGKRKLVTITLDDVASLLHLPITGAFHTFDALHLDQAMDLLSVHKKQEIRHFNAMGHIFGYPGCETFITVAARAYLLHLVGCTLFVKKNVTHVHVVFLDVFRDLSQTRSYSWGAAVLVHMYVNLIDVSKRIVKQLAGYITLLQCWNYEHFPIITSCIVAEDYHERRSQNLSRSHYFANKSNGVHVLSYIDQRRLCNSLTIPLTSAAPFLSIEEVDDRWMHFSEYLALVGQICVAPRLCAEACHAIVERLKRLINLRVVTEGTEAYTVTEECLRITRGVNTQGNVYVRSRRRRRTLDA
ncbi:Protein MAIN-LIKE 1 [Glycine soja]